MAMLNNQMVSLNFLGFDIVLRLIIPLGWKQDVFETEKPPDIPHQALYKHV